MGSSRLHDPNRRAAWALTRRTSFTMAGLRTGHLARIVGRMIRAPARLAPTSARVLLRGLAGFSARTIRCVVVTQGETVDDADRHTLRLGKILGREQRPGPGSLYD